MKPFPLAARVLVCALLAGCSNADRVKKEHFDNAERLKAAGKLQEAIAEYQVALKDDQNYGEARLGLARAQQAAGNQVEAYKEFMRAAELMPESDEAQVQTARYLAAAGSFADARSRVQPVVERDPKNAQALIVLGSALVGLQDLDRAVIEIEEALRLQPGVPAYSSLAFAKLAQGDKEAARSALEKAIEADPKSMGARLALAYFHWTNDDLPAAEAAYRSAIALDLKNTLANRSIAAFYVGTERPQLAEPFLKAMAETGDVAAVFHLADFYLSHNRTAEAGRVLTPLVDNPETQNDANVRFAAIAYANNDAAGAHALLDKVRLQDPNMGMASVLKAQWLMLERKPKEALAPAQAAVKSNPRSAEAHFTLGLVQNELRLRKEAMASFKQVVQLNARASRAQLYLSRLNLIEGETDEAVSLAENALANSPNDPEARLGLVQGLLARRDTGRAAPEVARLVKDYPQSAMVHVLAAQVKAQQRDLVGARVEYTRALELSPDLVEAVAGITALDLAQNRVVEARGRIEARLASKPDNVEFLMIAGQVYGALRDFPKAEASLKKAIENDPGASRAYTMLATILVASGKLDDGLAEFERIAQRDSKNISARMMAAMIVHAQGKKEDAKKRYEEILSLSPASAMAANNLAWLYQEENTKLDDALRLAQGAAERVPDNPSVHDTIGMIYFKKEQLEPAIAAFERSVALAPDNASYQYHLAMALARAGDYRAARQAAQRAVKLRPGFAEAQKLLDQTPG
jgi:tetratricopeptide (TPR) repeat protein